MLEALRLRLDRLGRPLRFMEVCGTHTHAFSSTGLRHLLEGRLELRSGPGCPVCVTSATDVGRALYLARRSDVILCTYGDMMRVPGGGSSLASERARGADVRVVYSAADALDIADKESDRQVVFLGVGFETTAPALALALERARGSDADNFRILSLQKTLPGALVSLLSSGDIGLDGLILPGHVATVAGRSAFDFVAADLGLPAAVVGFEPVDLLAGLLRLVDGVASGNRRVDNAYPRAVRDEGNPRARALVEKYFRPVDAEWRGLGTVPDSGLRLRADFAGFDAADMIPRDLAPAGDPPGCRCADVLTGAILPGECALFGDGCTPRDPAGPCMVSSEGACAAHYRYGGGADRG